MRHLLLISLIVFSGFFQAFAQNLDITLLKVQQLQTVLVQNESLLNSLQLQQIDVLLNQAHSLALTSAGQSEYTLCRQAGFNHESCKGQGKVF